MWYRFSDKVQAELKIPKGLMSILELLKKHGLRALIVGGAVRDHLFGLYPKDIDVEVYGINYENLEAILNSVRGAKVNTVGKSFGIIKLIDEHGNDYDFSIPRRESKTGIGHTGFKAEFNTNITPQEAASRRDFTMNSLAYDPFTHEILDFFGGVDDIKNRVLRHTSDAFSEDPLRVLRGLQFAARMGLTIAPETAELAQNIKDEYKYISKERVEQEFHKLVTKGKKPGSAIKYLYDTRWSEHFPEIHNLKNVEQEAEYHPEIYVDVHTAHVMDAAADIADRENLNSDDRAVLIYAALCHDFAKPSTTRTEEKKGVMRITSPGHEKAGGPLARSFLQNIGVKKDIINKVVPLVENHLAHLTVDNKNLPGLSKRLFPANIYLLSLLVEADHSGRPPLAKEMPKQMRDLAEQAKTRGFDLDVPKNFVKWQDLINMGFPVNDPVKTIDPNGIEKTLPLGRVLVDKIYNLQLKGKIENRDDAIMFLEKEARNRLSIIKGNNRLFEVFGINGPEIGRILNEAYIAQKSGEFSNEGEAEMWLYEKLKHRHIG